jgi:FkbM family methyltransferase
MKYLCSKKQIILVISVAFILFFAYTKGIPFYQQATARGTFVVAEPLSKRIEAYYYKVFVRSSIYDFLRRTYYTFGIPKKGIIHIGARYAEEMLVYQDHAIPYVLWIESDPEAEAQLRKIVAVHKGSTVAMFAATDQNGTIMLHQTSNGGHSSSILPLHKHAEHYPDIKETKTIAVPQKRLDDYLSESQKAQYNVIVIDVQGAELIALRGAVKTLDHIDAVIAETNYDELYKGGVFVQDLDKFMDQHGFTRVDSVSIASYTGDALYVKRKFFQSRLRED